MKNTWIFGDVHGEIDKFKKCIESVDLKEGDRIISLGDLVDRGKYSFEVIEYCIELQNKYECYFIRGNHDYCFWRSMVEGGYNVLFNQGGRETLESYIKNVNPDKQLVLKMSGYSTDFELNDYPISHINFFNNQLNYLIDENNNCFVHGGFNRHYLVEDEKDEQVFYWDRDLLNSARSYSSMKNNIYPFKMKNKFKEVFVGHTPVQFFDSIIPVNYANIWDLDCGAGKYEDGTVCIMNLETKEYKQF